MSQTLIITTNDEPITVQDPNQSSATALSQSVINVPPNTTKSTDIPWEQLERLRPQLDSLQAIGRCTFTITGTGESAFAEQADNEGNPVIDYANTNTVTAASQALTVTGTNLMGGGAKATGTIEGDTTAGSVAIETTGPGNAGNLVDIEVVDSAAGGLAVAVNVVAGRQVVSVDLGGSAGETCTTVAGIINNAASATYGLLFATVVGTGSTPITATQDLEPLTGGLGTGFSVTLAGAACTVVSIDETAAPIIVVTLATPNLTPLSLSTGAPLNLQLRSNSKITNLTLGHA